MGTYKSESVNNNQKRSAGGCTIFYQKTFSYQGTLDLTQQACSDFLALPSCNISLLPASVLRWGEFILGCIQKGSRPGLHCLRRLDQEPDDAQP